MAIDLRHSDRAGEVVDVGEVTAAVGDSVGTERVGGREEEVERGWFERKQRAARDKSRVGFGECGCLGELRQPHAGCRRGPSRNRSCADEVAPGHRAIPEMGVTYMAVVQSHPHLLSQPFPVGCDSPDKCWIRGRYRTA